MDNFAQQFREMWNRWQALSSANKFAWSAGCAVCLSVAGLIWWVAQPEYRVLFSGLPSEDAGVITGKLQTKGVPFKLASGGTTILVPADQEMQVRLDLATEGMPNASRIGKGFDLFDQPMLGATPFAQNINFMRAQQAEVAKTLMQIDPIQFARVHIVRPEPSPFIRDHKPTTASVMVKLRPGASLNRNTISAIGSLVSGSVEGLSRDNVRIIDSHGRLLSDNNESGSEVMGAFIEQRKEVEHYLASEAERVLNHVLGNGRAIVRVTAELNTKQMREKKEIINIEGKVARSEKTTTNKTTSNSSGGGSRGGFVGTSSNLGKSGGGSSGSGSTSNQETSQSDYDYPRTIQEWHNKIGSIDRLTVAAFVDTSGPDGEQLVSLADVQEIIKKAIGFKQSRDEIQVTQVRVPSVNGKAFEEEWATHQRWQTILTAIRNGSIAMVALCGCVMGWVLFRRLSKPAPASNPTVTPEKMQQISAELDRNPEVLAKILSRWLESPESSDRVAA